MSGTLVSNNYISFMITHTKLAHTQVLPLLQELIKCDDVTVTIRPQDSLPSVSVDRCSNVHLNLNSPKGVSSDKVVLVSVQ